MRNNETLETKKNTKTTRNKKPVKDEFVEK